MTDRELARSRAREEGCKTVAPNEPSASTQPVRTPEERRPVAHCDPVIPATPTEFIKPSAVAVVTTTLPYGIPLPLIIVNTAVEVECADINGVGTIGDSVFIPAGKLQNFFILGDVPAITAAQLSYLATLDASQILAVITTQSDIALADFTNLTLDQCAFVKSAVFAIQEELNTQVIAAAYGAIDCFYGNESQSASCSGDAIQLSANIVPTDLGINNPSIVSAGTVLSKISVASANVEAAALAQALLVCVYGNDAMDVSCKDLGFVSPDFVPISDTEFNAPTAIHYEANTFVAATKIEANNIAKDAALSLLQCFYVNERVRVECGAEALETDPEVGSVNENTTGSIVIAEAGAVTSVVSAAAATAEAAIIATSLLRCSWGNDEATVSCGPVTIQNDTPCPGPKLEEPVTYKPGPGSTPPVTANENEFRSTLSKEHANAQAAAFLASSINCVYCNPQVLPTCVPKCITDKLEDVIAKRFIPDTCPPNPPVNGQTAEAAMARWMANPVLPLPLAIVTKDWSADATVGVAANTYCDSNPETAVAAAKAAGQIPIRSLIIPAEDPKSPPECDYCNDQIIVKTPPGMEDIAGGSITISPCTVKVKKSDIAKDFLCDKSTHGTCDEIPCEKQYANYLATSQATAILRPAFKSKEFKTSCGQMAFQKTNNVPPTAEQTAALTPLTYHSDSTGIPTNSIVIPAGAYESQISQKDADDQALVDAMGQLDCFFKNNPITVLCDDNPLKNSTARDPAKPTKGVIYGTGKLTRSNADGIKFGAPIAVDSTSAGSIDRPVEVELYVVTSYISQKDADDNAAKIGIPMLDCFWTNRPMELRIGAPDKYAETPEQEAEPEANIEFGTGVDVIDNIPGSKNQPVIVAPKTHKSRKSPKEANEEAYTTMGSRMVALYKSKKVTKECDPPVVKFTYGFPDKCPVAIKTKHILAKTAVSKVVLEEGQFTSSKSKKEADDLADVAATSMLLCIYTNAAIKNKTKCGDLYQSTTHLLDYQAALPNFSLYMGIARYAVKTIPDSINVDTAVRENDFAIQAEVETYLTLGPVDLEEGLFFSEDGIIWGSYFPNVQADLLLSSLQTCHVLAHPYGLGTRAYGGAQSIGNKPVDKLQVIKDKLGDIIGYKSEAVQTAVYGGTDDTQGNGWVNNALPSGIEAKDTWDRSKIFYDKYNDSAYGFAGPVTRFETVNNSVIAYTREIKADSKGAIWFVGGETKTELVASTVHPLKLIIANTDSLARIRVVYGFVAGLLADAGMNLGDTPVFNKTVTTSGHIYVRLVVTFDTDAGFWKPAVSAVPVIMADATTPVGDSTNMYMQIGSYVVTDGKVVSVAQVVSGSQFWSRSGNATYYTDDFVLR